MVRTNYFLRMLLMFCFLFNISQLVHSVSTPVVSITKGKDVTLSDQSDETKIDETQFTLKSIRTSTPAVLVTQIYDKVESRATEPANNIAEIIQGKDKIKTAATAPFGFAANDLRYDSPPSIGVQVQGPIQPNHPLYAGLQGLHHGPLGVEVINNGQPAGVGLQHGQPGGGVGLQHGQLVGVGLQHGQPVGVGLQHGQPLGVGLQHGQPGVYGLNQGQPGFHGSLNHGQPGLQVLNYGQPGIYGLNQGQPHGIRPVADYNGVVYAGHGYGNGNALGFEQERVSINKQSDIGIGTFGQDHRSNIIQKSINRIETLPGTPPLNYYGDRGVVHIGHSDLGAGHLGHYPPGNFALSRYSAPFGGAGGFQGINPNPNDYDFNLVNLNPYNPNQVVPFHQGPGFAHNGFQQQGVIINKQTEIGVDPYGGVHRDINVQKTAAVSVEGLGYNGAQNNVIAQSGRRHIAPVGYGGLGPGPISQSHGPDFTRSAGFQGQDLYDPFPNFNQNQNQIDPAYNGRDARLLTTGPNRFYERMNPAGIYERYHRFV